ncbi:MAG: SDR family NAD(P)-dependent oxidoreductase [Ignavibacteria bacterium]|nr:SDR family NAD(P)-dependent oxidoreductase [Ignavibacteria bacterium]
MSFEDKVFLITGASDGIGLTLARKLAKMNVKLALVSRNEEKLKLVANELLSAQPNLIYKKCDVTKLDEVQSAVKFTLEKFGRIDFAILNAGIGNRIWAIDNDFEKVREIFETNLFGVLNFIKYLIPIFLNQKYGVIVGVSSLADARGFPGSSAYCASKSALTTYLESIRVELKSHNIRVVTVRPGFVDTKMIKANEFKMSFILPVEKSAEKIINGLRYEKPVIQFPLFWVAVSNLAKIFPARLFDFLMKFRKNVRKP